MNSGASFLTRLPLFADVSPEMLATLEHRMRRREFAPRSVIEFLLAEVGEGELVGEMALLTRKPRAASVVDIEATTCGIIEQSAFDQLLTEHPPAVWAMMAALANRRYTAWLLTEALTSVEEVTSVVRVDI